MLLKKISRLLNSDKINYIDLGSRYGLEHRYQALSELINYVSLDASDDKAGLAVCIGDGTRDTLYITSEPGCSSLYLPNNDVLRKFEALDRYRIVDKVKVVTKRLDQALQDELFASSFVNIDLQGADAFVVDEICSGGFDKRQILAFQFEVNFLPIYSDAPAASELLAIVEENEDWVLQGFNRVCRWNPTNSGDFGILAWADAVCFVKPRRLTEWLMVIDDAGARNGVALKYAALCIVMRNSEFLFEFYDNASSQGVLDEETLSIIRSSLKRMRILRHYNRCIGYCLNSFLRLFSKSAHAVIVE